MAKYNRVITDAGKGRQMLHRSKATAVLASGTVKVVIDQIPVPFRIRRVLVGSAVATNINGDCNVLALAKGADLDTAPDPTAITGNEVITPIGNFTTKKLLDSDDIALGAAGALTAIGKTKFAKDTILLLSVAHNGAVVGGDVHCIVEWDVVGLSYGGYESGEDAASTYE